MFEIGDYVKIISELPSRREMEDIGWSDEMTKMLGKVGEIQYVNIYHDSYRVAIPGNNDDYGWCFYTRWLTKVPNPADIPPAKLYAVVEGDKAPRVYLDRKRAARRARYIGGTLVPFEELGEILCRT